MSKNPTWDAVQRVRLGHVRKLLQHRYGPTLPDDDAGREDMRILLHVKAGCYRPERRMQALISEIEILAPWLNGEAGKVAAEIAAKPLNLKSDTIGRMLNLDWHTRDKLRLWQIGAVDLDTEARKERRKLRHRQWMKDIRRDQGAKPRAKYEAESLMKTKPWQAEGISRRTWYRRQSHDPVAQVREQTNVAQVREQSTFLNPGHTLVPRHKRGSGSDRGGSDRAHNHGTGRRRCRK